jgi:hypothetical protein
MGGAFRLTLSPRRLCPYPQCRAHRSRVEPGDRQTCQLSTVSCILAIYILMRIETETDESQSTLALERAHPSTRILGPRREGGDLGESRICGTDVLGLMIHF